MRSALGISLRAGRERPTSLRPSLQARAPRNASAPLVATRASCTRWCMCVTSRNAPGCKRIRQWISVRWRPMIISPLWVRDIGAVGRRQNSPDGTRRVGCHSLYDTARGGCDLPQLGRWTRRILPRLRASITSTQLPAKCGPSPSLFNQSARGHGAHRVAEP